MGPLGRPGRDGGGGGWRLTALLRRSHETSDIVFSVRQESGIELEAVYELTYTASRSYGIDRYHSPLQSQYFGASTLAQMIYSC